MFLEFYRVLGGWRQRWLEAPMVGLLEAQVVGGVVGWRYRWLGVVMVGTYPDLGLLEARVIGGTGGWYYC